MNSDLYVVEQKHPHKRLGNGITCDIKKKLFSIKKCATRPMVAKNAKCDDGKFTLSTSNFSFSLPIHTSFFMFVHCDIEKINWLDYMDTHIHTPWG